jgi:hypothetical protein
LAQSARTEDSLAQWQHWAKEAVYSMGRQEWRTAITRLERAYAAAQNAHNLELTWASSILLSTVLELGGFHVETPETGAPVQQASSDEAQPHPKPSFLQNDPISRRYSEFRAKFSR